MYTHFSQVIISFHYFSLIYYRLIIHIDHLNKFYRLSRVSRLWWQVSTTPQLWHTLDLGPSRVNEKHKTERMLFWLLENRLSHAQDLALGSYYNSIIMINFIM